MSSLTHSLTLILTCLMLGLVDRLAADCDYHQQYSHNGRCCDFCPPGHFVNAHCSKGHRTTCMPCSPGTYSQVTDNLDSCKPCTTCEQVTLRECSTTLDANCSCREGFLCTSRQCNNCQKKEICPRGHELITTGNYMYSFHCEPCSDGMYSDTDGGVCKALTRCEQLGLETIFAGNKTHNSRCRTHGPTREPDKASVNSEVILAVVLLFCTFTSLVVLLKTCISKLGHKKQRKPTNSTVEACLSMTMELPDETTACHLSKEERGDRPIQELDHKTSLTSQMTV